MTAVHDPRIYFAKNILSHFAPMSHFAPGYANERKLKQGVKVFLFLHTSLFLTPKAKKKKLPLSAFFFLSRVPSDYPVNKELMIANYYVIK